jgi:Fe-S cluster assembly protein SufD
MSALQQQLAATVPPGTVLPALPNARTEHWRYTALRALESAARSWNTSAAASNLAASALASRLGLQPQDVLAQHAIALRDAEQPLPGAVQLSAQRSAFSFAAAANIGSCITLHGTQLYVCASELAQQFAQRALRFVVPAHTQATLLLEHASASDVERFCNLLLQLDVQQGATLHVINVQRAGARAAVMQRTEAALAKDAALHLVDLQLSTGWSRHEIACALLQSNAQVHTSVLARTAGRQHVDVQLSLHHLAADCRSDTRAKAIANDRSRFIFNGKIAVAAGADGTDAALQSNNLLLSDQAEIDVKPELEIDAEEVRCSHGATIGKLDENALFYLRARGIDEGSARAMLMHAFAAELLSRVQDSRLRDALAELLETEQTMREGARP